MACTRVALPGSSASAAGAAAKEMFGMRRSVSAHDVRDRRRMRRCLSEPQIRCSVNQAKSKYSGGGTPGVSQFPFSARMVQSFLFEETQYEEVKVEGEVEEGKKKKKGNWVEQLLKLRELWQERQSDKGEDHVEAKELEEEAVCEVSYEEDELEASTAVVDRSSFSRYLVPISWARMELFSRLAFLCNMAYVVPEIKVCYLSNFTNYNYIS